MPILVRDLKLDLEEPEELLLDRAAARLKVPRDAIRCYAPVRRSLDARHRDRINFVYCLEIALDRAGSERQVVRRLRRDDVRLLHPRPAQEPASGPEPMSERPVVAGFGPAGMMAAYELARRGYRPVILERGQPVRTRHKDILLKFYRHGVFNPESNLLFGEGGAGAYSDGKLYTRVNDPYTHVILEILYQHGADPAILIEGRPHIGSDRLPNICMRLRRHIEELGGDIRFGSRLERLVYDDHGRIIGVGTGAEVIPTRHLLLAIGHSARDTLRALLAQGVAMVAKPFQLGVRIEHPQSLVDGWQYGLLAGHPKLPPAEYHLVAKNAALGSGDVFSFCMCPGGTILPSHEAPGLIATNGASRSGRSGPFANSGLVMTIGVEHFDNDPLKGLALQEQLEGRAFEATGRTYAVPAQRADDFVADRSSSGALHTSYPLGGQWTVIRRLLPGFVVDSVVRGLEILDRRLPGFAGPDGVVTAPESRASAPVRVLRDAHSRESVSTAGLFPIGEGAGYAGGIMSAAIDALKTVHHVISRCGPPR